ncbi:hypothetical protein RCL1_002516 [Eukaryota sp. TZLM3-RCL]
MTSIDVSIQTCRLLDTKLGSKLQQLSSVMVGLRSPDSHADDALSLCSNLKSDIESLLSELRECLDNISESSHNQPPFQALHVLRNAYENKLREFHTTLSIISKERNRRSLLDGALQHSPSAILTDDVTRSRVSLASSHSIADELIEQVDVARARLLEQGSALDNVGNRVTGISGAFAVMNNLLKSTRYRRLRNMIIWALVVSTILFFLIIRSN